MDSPIHIQGEKAISLSYGHTQLNPPHPVRSAKLNSRWQSQYYGGGPHGNTLCCSFFLFFFEFDFCFTLRTPLPPIHVQGEKAISLSYGHTQLNPPHPVRSAKLNSRWQSQYYGGGPHGNTLCCSFLFFFC